MNTNMPFQFGQRYKKRNLAAGVSWEEDGICTGLSLAWLKRVQIHGDLRIFPTYLEGVLGQNAYQFGDSVSASINTGLAGLAGFDFVFQRLGFQRVWHKDLLGAYDVVREVMMSGMATLGDHAGAGYLVLLDAHVVALATVGCEVALYDPNAGILIFDLREAADMVQLRSALDAVLIDYCELPFFNLTRLAY